MIGLGFRTAALTALSATGACAPPNDLAAGWYLIAPPSAVNGSSDRILVILVNQGQRPVTIHDVALNQKDNMLTIPARPEKGKALPSGATISFATDLLDRDSSGQPRCAVPVQLFVRLGAASGKQQRVKIAGALPTSLPEKWLEEGGCVSMPVLPSAPANTADSHQP